MKCKICNSGTRDFATKKVLDKYEVKYFQCPACKFIQTEEPFWLDEAYKNAITKLDIGLVYRNEHITPIISTIIKLLFSEGKRFIDYGGGYGLFVRMMRDRGFDFYRQDIYCENLFAKHFDLSDLSPNSRFDILTAFEVFEHLPDPVGEVKKMLEFSDNILFTTELQPKSYEELKDWWYLMPDLGQHISLYTEESLFKLAEKFNLHLLSAGSVHLLTKKAKNKLIFKMAFRRIVQNICNRKRNRSSLLMTDLDRLKKLHNIN